MRLLTVGLGGVLMMSAACQESDEVPIELTPDSGVAGQVSALDQATLDVLFVIDNSGSMATEQQKLAREIPRMVAVLTSGDRYATRESQVPPGLSDKARRFTPVSSLHVGVVSTNFGGLDELPYNAQAAILACNGTGDGGKLQNSLKIAQEGVIAQSRSEFVGFEVGQALLTPDPACALPPQPLYQTFDPNIDPAAASLAFGCAARLGVRGCPFEQPLESMWAALAPSQGQGELYQFLNGTRGVGDTFNQGFVRPGAALAVIVLTDEDDCSITDEGKGLFSLEQEAEAEYGNLNLRCIAFGQDKTLVHALTRYRDGLLGLKGGRSDRIAFTAIAGFPLDARTRTPDSILADPAMAAQENSRNPGFPYTACSAGLLDEAYPSRRLAEAAKLFPNALTESICADSYAPVVDETVNKIAPMMGP
ncbi:MAG: hypothetical protein ABW352_10290 [Polyangiales bacterium]